jgi:hypothetical protein
VHGPFNASTFLAQHLLGSIADASHSMTYICQAYLDDLGLSIPPPNDHDLIS